MDIQIGKRHSETVLVNESNTARAVGSGQVDVFGTPMMIALLEEAAANCIQPGLDPGQASVGTHVNVSHSGATPIGMQVTATATVTKVDRRQVEFDILVEDETGEVGRGSHTRFVIDLERFMAKANGKKGQ